VKDAVIKMAHQSDGLKICRDLCNGTKHLGRHHRPSSGTGASHQYVDMTIAPEKGQFEMECILDDGNGNEISGKELAHKCIAEWERILQSQGLVTARLS
jgi:hypothetical protein